ncbi:MAG TPA: MarR family transcriptional regulator [Dehalococcoidia bacterium]|nr:MarR family transcriptional regulator [Dehalococcoidia bacterium]HAS28388.1 MarR family transcriptional regulator [Dehalococcoidia bacterium]
MKEELIEKVIKSRRHMNRFIREGSVESWINLNLTIPQMKCLSYISQHGKTNLSGLAAGINVTPANVTGIVDRLVAQGFVTRNPDSADRRVIWLGVTEIGESTLSNLREGRSGKMRELLECLSDNELSIVSQSFDILAGAVNKLKESDDGND